MRQHGWMLTICTCPRLRKHATEVCNPLKKWAGFAVIKLPASCSGSSGLQASTWHANWCSVLSIPATVFSIQEPRRDSLMQLVEIMIPVHSLTCRAGMRRQKCIHAYNPCMHAVWRATIAFSISSVCPCKYHSIVTLGQSMHIVH